MTQAIYIGGPKHGVVERIGNGLLGVSVCPSRESVYDWGIPWKRTHYRRVGFTAYGKRATMLLALGIDPQSDAVADAMTHWLWVRDSSGEEL